LFSNIILKIKFAIFSIEIIIGFSPTRIPSIIVDLKSLRNGGERTRMKFIA